MIKRYVPEIIRAYETCDDEAVLEENTEGCCVLVDDVLDRLEEIADYMSSKGHAWLMLNKLIEELK